MWRFLRLAQLSVQKRPGPGSSLGPSLSWRCTLHPPRPVCASEIADATTAWEEAHTSSGCCQALTRLYPPEPLPGDSGVLQNSVPSQIKYPRCNPSRGRMNRCPPTFWALYSC